MYGQYFPRYCSSKVGICQLKLHFKSAKPEGFCCPIAGFGWQSHAHQNWTGFGGLRRTNVSWLLLTLTSLMAWERFNFFYYKKHCRVSSAKPSVLQLTYSPIYYLLENYLSCCIFNEGSRSNANKSVEYHQL